MKKTKKKIREYLTKGVRRIKHRKGFGVHSPFAFAIITEVIEEKTPYYAYATLRRAHAGHSNLPFKAASLLFRLADRFACQHSLVIGNDAGCALLPLMLVDSRSHIYAFPGDELADETRTRLSLCGARSGTFLQCASLNEIPEGQLLDMVVVHDMPEGMTAVELSRWIMEHTSPQSVLFLRNIRRGAPLYDLWEQFCDADNVEITMDLYDYGLVIRRPRFFKQHYIVSF